jgi:hypothetical protein
VSSLCEEKWSRGRKKGIHPVPEPNWGYGVAQRNIRRLQPLHDVIQRLLQGGLTGMDLLQTFVSHRIQPLH